MQVADHCVVGDRHDRRLGIRVDGENPLGALAAGNMLRRPGHAARDVDLGRDLVTRLADLVGVRTPAGHRHRARAPDRAFQQRGKLLHRGEAFGRADAASACDHDLCVRERDAARRRRDAVANPDDEVALGELGRERLDRPRAPLFGCGDRVRSDGQQRPACVQARLLEQAAAPADAGERDRITGPDCSAIRRQRLAKAGRRTCHGVGGVLGSGCDDGCRADSAPPPRR